MVYIIAQHSYEMYNYSISAWSNMKEFLHILHIECIFVNHKIIISYIILYIIQMFGILDPSDVHWLESDEYMGRRVIAISGSLIWSKILMELIFNLCGEYRWSPEGPVCQIHFSHLHVEAPGIFSDLLRFIQMLKRQWCAESNGKLQHIYIPNKTATFVLEFAVEDLPFHPVFYNHSQHCSLRLFDITAL